MWFPQRYTAAPRWTSPMPPTQCGMATWLVGKLRTHVTMATSGRRARDSALSIGWQMDEAVIDVPRSVSVFSE